MVLTKPDTNSTTTGEPITTASKAQIEAEHKANEELRKKLEDMEEQLAANAMIMGEYEKTFEDKVNDMANMQEDEDIIDFTKSSHLVNVNEDPILSGKIMIDLSKEAEVYVGRKNGDPAPQIILGGIGIKSNHATFVTDDCNNVFLIPADEDCGQYIFVNGENCCEMTQLFH